MLPAGHREGGDQRHGHHASPGAGEAAAAAGAWQGCRETALLDPPPAREEAVHVRVCLGAAGPPLAELLDAAGERVVVGAAPGLALFMRSGLWQLPPAEDGGGAPPATQRCGFRRAEAEWVSGLSSGWGVAVAVGVKVIWTPPIIFCMEKH